MERVSECVPLQIGLFLFSTRHFYYKLLHAFYFSRWNLFLISSHAFAYQHRMCVYAKRYIMHGLCDLIRISLFTSVKQTNNLILYFEKKKKSHCKSNIHIIWNHNRRNSWHFFPIMQSKPISNATLNYGNAQENWTRAREPELRRESKRARERNSKKNWASQSCWMSAHCLWNMCKTWYFIVKLKDP